MIFHPQNLIPAEGSYRFEKNVHATAHPALDKPIIREFWQNFTHRSSTLELSPSDQLIFAIGDTEPLPLDGAAYSMRIDENGVCVLAESEQDLLHGFMTLLDRLHAIDCDGELAVVADCCQLRERALIGARMVHYCLFPENSLRDLQHFVRFCAALKYTHVVLEFWGTFKYECLDALSWPGAYTKEELRPIIREAQDLGLEVIPMFNHWGHASASREMQGKHVVLDQDPTLQTYFSEDGWCWSIQSPRVRDLLHRVRAELIDLCGKGSYFHLGCDEARNFELNRENMDLLCEYINGIAEELKELGRRAIVWGDMFLYRHPHYNPKNRYTCNAPSPEVESYLLDHLSRDLIIADWQYHSPEFPIETSSVFQNAGFTCFLCPWDEGIPQMQAAVKTVKEQALNGIMHTTWHTLSGKMSFVTMAAIGGFESLDEYTRHKGGTITAGLWRRVMPSNGSYEDAGWAKKQIDVYWK